MILVCQDEMCSVVWSVFWSAWGWVEKCWFSGFWWVDEGLHDERCPVFVELEDSHELCLSGAVGVCGGFLVMMRMTFFCNRCSGWM